MNLSQALQALESLAPQLGLPKGLDGWEVLAQRMQNGERTEFDEGKEVNKLEQIKRFIHAVMEAVRSNSAKAGQYFEVVSQMATDSNVPSHVMELGKVLQQFMTGVKSPDLSGLPEEIRVIVQEELKI